MERHSASASLVDSLSDDRVPPRPLLLPLVFRALDRVKLLGPRVVITIEYRRISRLLCFVSSLHGGWLLKLHLIISSSYVAVRDRVSEHFVVPARSSASLQIIIDTRIANQAA